MELMRWLKVINIIVTVVFVVEVILYWIDDFYRYWQGVRIMDFIITVFCVLNEVIEARTKTFILDNITKNPDWCETNISFGGQEYDISQMCQSNNTSDENTIINYILQRRNDTTVVQQFLGSNVKLYCDVRSYKGLVDDGSFWPWYLCGISSTDAITFVSSFGYNGLFTIFRALRFMKVTLMNKRVREILKGVRRAMTQMKLILILILVILLIFGLLFNGIMLSKSNSQHPGEWTFEEFQTKTETKLRNNLNTSVFTGFVNFWWTLSILFQMMTLDQWADTFKSIQEAHFNPILGYNATFCDLHAAVMFDGNGNSERFTWIFMLCGLFMWLYIGNFIFKNLITGIGVNSILVVLNERRWAENEAIVEKELASIAGEIEEECKNNDAPDADIASDDISQYSDTSECVTRIEQIELDSIYTRMNIYKPWKWRIIQRKFPKFISFLNRVSPKLIWMKERSTLGARRLLSKVHSISNASEEQEMTSERTSHMTRMRSTLHGDVRITVNAPSLMAQISRKSNLGFTNNFTQGLQQARNQGPSLSPTAELPTTQSKESSAKNSRKLSTSSGQRSDFSLLSERKSQAFDEIASNDFDLTQLELAVQVHLDKINGYPKESLWPRDTLFKYLQLMESLQENVQERSELFKLFSQSIVDDHDT